MGQNYSSSKYLDGKDTFDYFHPKIKLEWICKCKKGNNCDFLEFSGGKNELYAFQLYEVFKGFLLKEDMKNTSTNDTSSTVESSVEEIKNETKFFKSDENEGSLQWLLYHAFDKKEFNTIPFLYKKCSWIPENSPHLTDFRDKIHFVFISPKEYLLDIFSGISSKLISKNVSSFPLLSSHFESYPRFNIFYECFNYFKRNNQKFKESQRDVAELCLTEGDKSVLKEKFPKEDTEEIKYINETYMISFYNRFKLNDVYEQFIELDTEENKDKYLAIHFMFDNGYQTHLIRRLHKYLGKAITDKISGKEYKTGDVIENDDNLIEPYNNDKSIKKIVNQNIKYYYEQCVYKTDCGSEFFEKVKDAYKNHEHYKNIQSIVSIAIYSSP